MNQETKQCPMDTQDVVELLFNIATQIETIIGNKGAVSIFRYAGKQMGKKIGANRQGGTDEEARSLVSEFFREKEFMQSIQLDGHEAHLTGCKIGLTLRDHGTPAGNHALCHFGFGLIDGVNEAVTGKKIITLHVSSKYHADGVACKETW